MTRPSLFLLIACFALPHAGQAQTIFPSIREAVKSGNASQVATYFNNAIHLNIDGEIGTYSKAKAEVVLREFFKKHAPTDFTIVHTGTSRGGLQFAIGLYTCGPERFDVLMRVREVEKTHLIHELSFAKD